MKPDSSSELSAFMDYHKLKDPYGNAQFPATIQFYLKSGEYEIDSNVMINRVGYNNDGKVIILSEQPLTTPVEFWAHFQKFEFIDSEGLQISGTHKKQAIGKYKVIIIPIK